MKAAGEEMKIKGHISGKNDGAKYLYSPVDIEGHLGTDGRYYVV